MTDQYEWIRNYYVKNMYKPVDLETFVRAGWITQEQLDSIIKHKEDLERSQHDVLQTDTES
jgi:hypothetical protein